MIKLVLLVNVVYVTWLDCKLDKMDLYVESLLRYSKRVCKD